MALQEKKEELKEKAIPEVVEHVVGDVIGEENQVEKTPSPISLPIIQDVVQSKVSISSGLGDFVMRKSKLEIARDEAKAREAATENFVPLYKRRQLEHQTSSNFMSNVVIRKSRLQLEKEAAIRTQMEEKENELKKGL